MLFRSPHAIKLYLFHFAIAHWFDLNELKIDMLEDGKFECALTSFDAPHDGAYKCSYTKRCIYCTKKEAFLNSLNVKAGAGANEIGLPCKFDEGEHINIINSKSDGINLAQLLN